MVINGANEYIRAVCEEMALGYDEAARRACLEE